MLLIKYHHLQFLVPRPEPAFCICDEKTWNAHLDFCEKLFASGNWVVLSRKQRRIEVDCYEEYLKYFRTKRLDSRSVEDLCKVYGCRITTGVGDFQFANIKNISREDPCDYLCH